MMTVRISDEDSLLEPVHSVECDMSWTDRRCLTMVARREVAGGGRAGAKQGRSFEFGEHCT